MPGLPYTSYNGVGCPATVCLLLGNILCYKVSWNAKCQRLQNKIFFLGLMF